MSNHVFDNNQILSWYFRWRHAAYGRARLDIHVILYWQWSDSVGGNGLEDNENTFGLDSPEIIFFQSMFCSKRFKLNLQTLKPYFFTIAFLPLFSKFSKSGIWSEFKSRSEWSDRSLTSAVQCKSRFVFWSHFKSGNIKNPFFESLSSKTIRSISLHFEASFSRIL